MVSPIFAISKIPDYKVFLPFFGRFIIWLCIKVIDAGIDFLKVQSGNPTKSEHGFGVGVDGNLYLIINERLLASKQADKLSLLKNKSSYYMEEDETIPQSLLSSIKL
ncbi:MAG: hypothetical protein IPG85_13220 [Bacteroidetes bacterium]|nr:hypothetical protein [Bacteroidota bacterium]